jgi:hypothetical protein
MPRFQVGDIVTTKKPYEALYSKMYSGLSCEYPEQWFTPGMTGKILAFNSPRVNRQGSDHVIEFEGIKYNGNKEGRWIVRIPSKDLLRFKSTRTV